MIRCKNPTEDSFYNWVKNYPNSKYWEERVKKCPEVMGCLEINKFYKFIKTACKNRALSWLNWNKVKNRIKRI